MVKRNLPGLGLVGGWPEGTNHWGGEMDGDLLTLSVVAQAYALGRVASEPGSPTDGDIWLLTGTTNANKFAVRDQGAWVYVTPTQGAIAYISNESTYYSYASGAWSPMATGGANSNDYQNSVRIACGPTEGNIDWATGGLLTLQGVTLNDGDRVLLLAQTFGAENVIYNAHAGAWTQATGWTLHSGVISSGTVVPIDEGTYGGNLYQLLTANPIDVGVTPLVWQSNSRIGRTNFAVLNKTADYTLINTDNRRWIALKGATTQTLTLPPYASVNLPSMTEIIVQDQGSGNKIIQAAVGVTLNGVSAGAMAIASPLGAIWLKKLSRDVWTGIPLGSANVIVSDTTPVDASKNQLWWDSSSGNLYIYYFDGTNYQWVSVQSASTMPFVKTVLFADASFFVNTATGSDTNDGLTSGTAWKTLQHAYDWICGNLDQSGYTAYVNIAANASIPGFSSIANGKFKNITGPICFVGAGYATTVIKDVAEPYINYATPGPSSAIYFTDVTIGDGVHTPVYVQYNSSIFFGIKPNGTTGTVALNGGWTGVYAGNLGYLEFGPGSTIRCQLSGGNSVIWADSGAYFSTYHSNLVGVSCSFTDGFAYASQPQASFGYPTSVTGSFTGPKFKASMNATIIGGTGLPGSVAGTTATGAQVS